MKPANIELNEFLAQALEKAQKHHIKIKDRILDHKAANTEYYDRQLVHNHEMAERCAKEANKLRNTAHRERKALENAKQRTRKAREVAQ
jgi:hypothetical protein